MFSSYTSFVLPLARSFGSPLTAPACCPADQVLYTLAPRSPNIEQAQPPSSFLSPKPDSQPARTQRRSCCSGWLLLSVAANIAGECPDVRAHAATFISPPTVAATAASICPQNHGSLTDSMTSMISIAFETAGLLFLASSICLRFASSIFASSARLGVFDSCSARAFACARLARACLDRSRCCLFFLEFGAVRPALCARRPASLLRLGAVRRSCPALPLRAAASARSRSARSAASASAFALLPPPLPCASARRCAPLLPLSWPPQRGRLLPSPQPLRQPAWPRRSLEPRRRLRRAPFGLAEKLGER